MKKVIMILGICLCLNIYADDIVIDYTEYNTVNLYSVDNLRVEFNGTIDAQIQGVFKVNLNSIGSIVNYGTIEGGSWGIVTNAMAGHIDNYGDIKGYDAAIYAPYMIGNIYNNGKTSSTSGASINAVNMSGNIINDYQGDIVSATGLGINSEGMYGNITNYGKIRAFSAPAIFAFEMVGNIINNGDIKSNESGILATSMEGNIVNNLYGTIESFSYGIEARVMYGNITNYGRISAVESYAIYAYSMYGNITNYGTLDSGDAGIYAHSMQGNIVNHAGGIIKGADYGINAEEMEGNITNHGTIESTDSDAIKAYGMAGNIYNYGLIESSRNNTIDARWMSGFIYNEGRIIANAEDYVAIETAGKFEIYNYGLIEHENGGNAITADGDLSIIGNGTIIGEIYSDDEDWLSITNDMDTVLDLSDAPLVGWSIINLLGGEMIITEVDPADDTYITQYADTYVHSSIRDSSVQYTLEGGTLNPYNTSGSPFGSMYVGTFYALNEGTTIEIDFGAGDRDFILVQENGVVSPGVTIKFIPQEILKVGWYNLYQIFSGITVTPEVVLESSLFYEVEQVYFENQPQGILVELPEDFWVEINRSHDTYADYANDYNQGFAKMLDSIGNEPENEEAEDLMLELEQVTTADELNDLLEPYNMVGYASLANNNINWINNRVGNLFGILGGSIGAASDVVSNATGSSYATGNSSVGRDFNGNNVWFEVYMSDTTLDGKAGYEQESDGYEVAFGIDKEINASLILGVSLNISDFESDITGGLPVSVESDGFGINFYGQYYQGQISHKFATGYTGYENEATRAGSKADFDSNEFYAAYRIEYTIEKNNCFIVPLAGLQYSHITYDDIIEDGSNSGLEGYDYDSLQSEFGVKLIKQFNALRLDAGASWLHELMDTETDASAVSGIGSYSQDGIERDEDTFRLSLGLDYQISKRVNIGLDYAKEFGENTDSDSINGEISFSF